MLTIKQLDHVVLRVTDLKAMMAFYTEVIGCPVEKIQENLGLYQLRAGSSLIDLVPVDGPLGQKGGAAPGQEARNLDHFCLQVEPFDADAILGHLRSHGLDPAPVASRYGAKGQGPSIYVSDPEGNTLELKGPPDQI
jgi:catechol 2,3-dioxygenase-like lactoylglutathione lyase family enzyme